MVFVKLKKLRETITVCAGNQGLKLQYEEYECDYLNNYGQFK